MTHPKAANSRRVLARFMSLSSRKKRTCFTEIANCPRYESRKRQKVYRKKLHCEFHSANVWDERFDFRIGYAYRVRFAQSSVPGGFFWVVESPSPVMT